MSLAFRPMDRASVRAILEWRYQPPYDLYNLDPDDPEEAVRCYMDPGNAYHSVADERGNLVAFCCFGADAQVSGGDYGAPSLDIGLGVRPDLTGQGRGSVFVNAVLGFAQRSFEPTSFRVTVAEFNKRARRVWEKAGFEHVQTFERESDGRSFVVLMQQVARHRQPPTHSTRPRGKA